MSSMLVLGKNFSVTKYVMCDDIDDIQDPRYHMRRRTKLFNNALCTWVCMGLDGSTRTECLPERTCHFEPPEHVPRTSSRAQTYVRGPGGLPACHGAESTRNDPRPEEKKMPKGKKHMYTYIYIYISNRVDISIST